VPPSSEACDGMATLDVSDALPVRYPLVPHPCSPLPHSAPLPVRCSLAPHPCPCASSLRDLARALLPRFEALPARRHNNREGLIRHAMEQLQSAIDDERWTRRRRSTSSVLRFSSSRPWSWVVVVFHVCMPVGLACNSWMDRFRALNFGV